MIYIRNVGFINQALEQLQDWNKQGIELEVSVNIASHHLRSGPFFLQLSEAFAAHSTVNAHSLQLEVLESSALGDLDAISKIIKTVQHKLGVNVALDDFGSRYSSLTHLRNLSANTLKIDQSFVRDILEAPSDYAMIEGVIGLANAFNSKVIAEGVESHV
ncbi:MAG: EAL domain-containing protein [Pseudomonadota bacterium]|nr:EAL domain-containing protein [Pseudomonadota bacterium]MDO7711302.1 EAL domain-containing protein [Pseudomonadota bacterium]